MKNFNLSELNLENAGQWPFIIKAFMAGALAAALIALGYWVIIKPNFEEYNTLNAQLVTLKTDFEQKQQKAANIQAYRNQLQIMNEHFGNVLKQLPAEDEMPSLLEDISKTGVASGLTFELFAPMPEVVHDFYIELPINIIVLGSYQQLATFLSRIAQMSRIVTLHDLEVVVAPVDKQKTPTGDLLQMTITAKIYRYRTK